MRTAFRMRLAEPEGLQTTLISANTCPWGNVRVPVPDLPISLAADATYLKCGFRTARSVTSMPAANQSSPPVHPIICRFWYDRT